MSGFGGGLGKRSMESILSQRFQTGIARMILFLVCLKLVVLITAQIQPLAVPHQFFDLTSVQANSFARLRKLHSTRSSIQRLHFFVGQTNFLASLSTPDSIGLSSCFWHLNRSNRLLPSSANSRWLADL